MIKGLFPAVAEAVLEAEMVADVAELVPVRVAAVPAAEAALLMAEAATEADDTAVSEEVEDAC